MQQCRFSHVFWGQVEISLSLSNICSFLLSHTPCYLKVIKQKCASMRTRFHLQLIPSATWIFTSFSGLNIGPWGTDACLCCLGAVNKLSAFTAFFLSGASFLMNQSKFAVMYLYTHYSLLWFILNLYGHCGSDAFLKSFHRSDLANVWGHSQHGVMADSVATIFSEPLKDGGTSPLSHCVSLSRTAIWAGCLTEIKSTGLAQTWHLWLKWNHYTCTHSHSLMCHPL